MLYQDIEKVGNDDPATEDLLIEIVREIDKSIYFLASHVEDDTSEDIYETGNDDDSDDEVIDDGEDATL